MLVPILSRAVAYRKEFQAHHTPVESSAGVLSLYEERPLRLLVYAPSYRPHQASNGRMENLVAFRARSSIAFRPPGGRLSELRLLLLSGRAHSPALRLGPASPPMAGPA